jgi:hypothetical protein
MKITMLVSKKNNTPTCDDKGNFAHQGDDLTHTSSSIIYPLILNLNFYKLKILQLILNKTIWTKGTNIRRYGDKHYQTKAMIAVLVVDLFKIQGKLKINK